VSTEQSPTLEFTLSITNFLDPYGRYDRFNSVTDRSKWSTSNGKGVVRGLRHFKSANSPFKLLLLFLGVVSIQKIYRGKYKKKSYAFPSANILGESKVNAFLLTAVDENLNL